MHISCWSGVLSVLLKVPGWSCSLNMVGHVDAKYDICWPRMIIFFSLSDVRLHVH